MKQSDNQNGFTMVELLTTIVILGVLATIAIPSIGQIVNQVRNQYYHTIEDSVQIAGKDYFSQNRGEQPKIEAYTAKVALDSLMNLNFIEEVVTSRGGERCTGYVIALRKENNKIEYHACLTCGGEYQTNSQYCEESYQPENNDQVYRVEAPDNFQSYLNEVLKPKYGKVYQRGVLINSKLLPKNTSTVNIKQEGTYPLEYSYQNAKDTTQVTIYELKPPVVTLSEISSTNQNLGTNSGSWTKENLRQNFVSNNHATGYQYLSNSTSNNWTTIANNSILREDVNETRYVRAIDNEGHFSQPTAYTVKIDKTAPNVTYTAGTRHDNQDLDVQIMLDDIGSGVKEFQYCMTTSSTCTPNQTVIGSTQTLTLTTHSNTNKICIKGYDNVGNVSNIICSGNYKVDKTPSCPSIVSNVTEKTWTNQTAVLTLTFADDMTRWEWSTNTDGNAYIDWWGSTEQVKDVTLSGEGIRQGKITVYHNDISNTCYTDQYYIDKTEPSCPSFTANLTKETWTNQQLKLKVTPSSDTTSYDYYVWESYLNDYYKYYTKTAKFTDTVGGQGVRQAKVVARDRANNTKTCYSDKYYIDKTAPSCTTSGGSTTYAMSRSITVSCTDSGGSGCQTSSKTYTYTTNTTTASYTVYDNAGNSGSCSANIYVSRDKPSVTFALSRDWTPAHKVCGFPLTARVSSDLSLSSVQWSGTGLINCSCQNAVNCISGCTIKANTDAGNSYYITLSATNAAGTTSVTQWYSLTSATSCP